MSVLSSLISLQHGEVCSVEYSEDDDSGDFDEIENAKEIIAFMKKERKMLMEKGIDVDKAIEDLERIIQQAEDSKAHLEDIKRQLVKSVSLIGKDDSTHPLDERLDMASKDLRKDEDVQEYFRRARRRARDHGDESENA